MDGETWHTTVHGVTKSRTRLSDFTHSLSLVLEASLIVQMGKNLPAMQETHVQSLGQEYPLEWEIATHSSILAWKIP